jgi:hypothetical protein
MALVSVVSSLSVSMMPSPDTRQLVRSSTSAMPGRHETCGLRMVTPAPAPSSTTPLLRKRPPEMRRTPAPMVTTRWRRSGSAAQAALAASIMACRSASWSSVPRGSMVSPAAPPDDSGGPQPSMCAETNATRPPAPRWMNLRRPSGHEASLRPSDGFGCLRVICGIPFRSFGALRAAGAAPRVGWTSRGPLGLGGQGGIASS